MRSLRDLIDCQEDIQGISYCQEGNKMRSEDLIDCQEGNREIPYCQEGKGEKMSSEMSSYQQGQLIEKEEQRNLLMIGGILIFLPLIPVEERVCVAEAATEDQQPT
jgi:hypothetical protein